jgi:hypothetical protein
MSETITKTYFGFVEDINDPDKRGRMRVRIAILDDQKEKQDLPWAFPLNPIQSASLYLDKVGGTGISPTGILPGSQVLVLLFYMADIPSTEIRLVLGTIPKVSPDGRKHDVPTLAMGVNDIIKTPVEFKGSANLPGVEFKEPKSSYNAKYPLNRVMKTPKGHTIEIDDSDGAERIHIYHGAGTYTEISFDGSQVTKVVGNDTAITMKDKTIYVEGEITIIAKNNVNIFSEKKIKLKAPEISINGD